MIGPRPPLRLVHPAPPQPKKKPAQRAPIFTPEEQARLRAALRHARGMFGTWACLADAMHMRLRRVEDAANGPTVSGDVAVRLARALGVSVESLYRPPTDAGKCPHCGAARGPT